MAEFIVSNLNDSGSGSLRQAIIDANNTEGEDVINFDPNLGEGTIVLTSGGFDITESVTINGLGVTKTTLDTRGIEGNTFNVSSIDRSFNTNIRGITIIGWNLDFDFSNNISVDRATLNVGEVTLFSEDLNNFITPLNITITDDRDLSLPENTNIITATDENDAIFGENSDDLIRAKELLQYQFVRNGTSATTTYTQTDGGGDFSVDDGNDFFNGQGGNDTIEGGYGNDTIEGGSGNDVLYGSFNPQFFNPYQERISSRRGFSFDRNESGFYLYQTFGRGVISEFYNTHQFTLDGDDVIKGGDGDDLIFDENGSNFVEGGDGNDTIESYSEDEGSYLGGSGNDSVVGLGNIQGGLGDDTLITTGDESVLRGGSGNDSLDGFYFTNDFSFGSYYVGEYYGGDGSDTISGYGLLDGGNGNDLLEVSSLSSDSSATLIGGSGNDTLSISGDDNRLFGGTGNDRLNGGGNLFGGGGDDTLEGEGKLFGGTGNDRLSGSGNLFGGIGNDTLEGNDTDDLLIGNEGDDRLLGKEGNDRLNGKEGNDTLIGNDGDDQIFGSFGDDFLRGERGRDTLNGGSGKDIFFIDNVTFKNRDIIRDFENNIDKLQLSGSLSFDELTIENNNLGTSTIIRSGNNNIIAVLNKIDASEIDESDFV